MNQNLSNPKLQPASVKKELHPDTLNWQLFVSGDPDAFIRLYDSCVQMLFVHGMRFTSDRELVKDCIHDIFEDLFKNRQKHRNIIKVRLYLMIALRNRLFNAFKRDNTNRTVKYIEPIFSPDYTIEDAVINNEIEEERKQQVLRALESLTPRQKEVIHYRYVENMSLDEIVQVMEMNYQSVLNLLQRSIKNAKKHLCGEYI